MSKPKKPQSNSFIAIVALGSILLILSMALFTNKRASEQSDSGFEGESSESTESANMSLVKNASELIFYYGITCPHCKDVEEYILDNELDQKLTIVKKEIYKNKTNSAELSQVAGSCGMDTKRVGVPFLVSEGKCFMGTPEVIAELNRQAAK